MHNDRGLRGKKNYVRMRKQTKGEGPEKSLAGSLSSSTEGLGKHWHRTGLYGVQCRGGIRERRRPMMSEDQV